MPSHIRQRVVRRAGHAGPVALLAATVLLAVGVTSPAHAAASPVVGSDAAGPATGIPALVDGLADPVDASVPAATAARTHLAGHKDRYHIPSPDHDLVADAVTADADGAETVRLDQKYRGVPVLGAQYVVRMTHK